MFILRDIPFSQSFIFKELWEKNREYHENISEHFGSIYSSLVFEERMNPFSLFDKDYIKISLAENSIDGKLLGYCISTIENAEGQTQSLHVDENARNSGIGKALMDSHINWMKNNGCNSITITVAAENTSTIQFYKTLGFRTNTLEMRLECNN